MIDFFSLSVAVANHIAINARLNNKIIHICSFDRIGRTSKQEKSLKRQTNQQLEIIPSNTKSGQIILSF